MTQTLIYFHVYFQLSDTKKLFNNIIIVYFKSNDCIHTPEVNIPL